VIKNENTSRLNVMAAAEFHPSVVKNKAKAFSRAPLTRNKLI